MAETRRGPANGSSILSGLPIVFESAGAGPNAGVLARTFEQSFHIHYTSQTVRIAGRSSVLTFLLADAQSKAALQLEEALPGRSNYIYSANPDEWRFDVKQFRAARIKNVYRGIDLVFHGRYGELEFDFGLKPGVNPENIRLVFDSAVEVNLRPDGDIESTVGQEVWRFRRPVAYQIGAGQERRLIPAEYRKSGKHTVSFRIGAFDRSKPLVIDPVWTYSSLIRIGFFANKIFVLSDSAGILYVAGGVASRQFPTRSAFSTQLTGQSDLGSAFVMKIDPSKPDAEKLLYSTYLGGELHDEAFAIALLPGGLIALAGFTNSAQFPVKDGAQIARTGSQSDGFLTVLDPARQGQQQLVYSTYLGGSGHDSISALIADGSSSLYAVGFTASGDFPGLDPAGPKPGLDGDVFLSKVNFRVQGPGSLSMSTKFGGTGSEFVAGAEMREEVLFVYGSTTSNDLPVLRPAQATLRGARDLFLAGFSVNSSRPQVFYATYLGGSDQDLAGGFAIDGAGRFWVSGTTHSVDFPVTANAIQPDYAGKGDALVFLLDPSKPAADQLLYSTYLGGTEFDAACCAVLEGRDRLLLAGLTDSSDFPYTRAAAAEPLTPRNGWLSRLAITPSMTLRVEKTDYWGGSAADSINSLSLGPDNAPLIAGVTESLDLMTTSSFGYEGGDRHSAFVSKLGDCEVRFNEPAAIVGGGGAQGSVSFTTGATCGWQTTSSQAWVTITGTTSGTGAGRISFTALPNSTGQVREAALLVSGSRFRIIQRLSALNADAKPRLSLTVTNVRSTQNCFTNVPRVSEFLSTDLEVGLIAIVEAPIGTEIYQYRFLSPTGVTSLVRPVLIGLPPGLSTPSICGWEYVPIRDNILGRSPGEWTVTLESLYSAPVSTKVTIVDPSASTAPKPEILPFGVTSGADFRPGFSAGGWLTIRGRNLSTRSRTWTGSDFNGTKLPTSLDGVSVTVNGKPAFPYYISPTQLNVLAPADENTGPVSVVVTNAAGISNPVAATLQRYAPAFFMFDPENRKYVAAVNSDGSYSGKSSLFGAGANIRPASTGDRVLLFATGLGPTLGNVPVGELNAAPLALSAATNLTITVGGVPAAIEFAGLISPGLYQVNLVIPEVPAGDREVVAIRNGTRSISTALLTIGSR
jgi:uncharacterized protein (TIGR03437 family)